MRVLHLTAAALMLSFVIPCGAQGVLERMEDEVATIAQHTRMAVVTIEDSRGLLLAYDTSPIEKADILSRIVSLDADHKAEQSRLAQLEQLRRAGAIDNLAILDVRDKIAASAQELIAERRRLDQFGRQSPMERLKQDVQDRLDLLNVEKQSMTNRASVLEQLTRSGAVAQSELEAAMLKLREIEDEIKNATAHRETYDRLLTAGVTANSVLHGAAQANAQFNYNAIVGQLGQAVEPAPRAGTGFSVGDGYIVTTADVLQGMNNPVVVTDSGAKIRATVAGLDQERNIGLIKLVGPARIDGLKLGDSDRAIAGHFAISIGNQHGQANAVALTLIAGLRTEGTYSGGHFYPSLIQIGGTVGAGTSGAPLLDSHGEVIGIMAGVPQALQESTASADARQLYGLATNRTGWTEFLNSTVAGNRSNNTVLSPAIYSLGTAPLTLASRLGSVGSNKSTKTAAKPLRKGANGTKKSSNAAAMRSNAVARDLTTPHTAFTRQASDAATALSYVLSHNNTVRYAQIPQSSNAANAMYNSLILQSPPINTLSATLAGSAEQVSPLVSSSGFAIPINDVQSALAAMKAGKPVAHCWIGVDLDDQEQATESNGIVTVTRSVKVKGVYAGSPALRAGVQPGDLIVSIDKAPVSTSSDVRARIVNRTQGDTAWVVVMRGHASLSFKLTLDERPAEPVISITVAPPAAQTVAPYTANPVPGSH